MTWQVKDFADGWIDVPDEASARALSAEQSGAYFRPKPATNPDSTRKAIRRSILKQEGVKRIEVVLDAVSVRKLGDIMASTGECQSNCVINAIERAHDRLTQPLTTNPL